MNKRGDMEELIKIATWIVFAIILLGAVYFLTQRLL